MGWRRVDPGCRGDGDDSKGSIAALERGRMIRILIADDHPFVRRGVKQVLTDEFSGVVIGEASTAPELLELAGKHQWNLIVLDLTMPGRDGLDALHELKSRYPEVPVLVLSMHPED